MTTKDDGGSAFPVAPNIDGMFYEGMTLRQWYAGQALVGMGNWWPNIPGDYEAKAYWAFAMADAMIAEGKKGETEE